MAKNEDEEMEKKREWASKREREEARRSNCRRDDAFELGALLVSKWPRHEPVAMFAIRFFMATCSVKERWNWNLGSSGRHLSLQA